MTTHTYRHFVCPEGHRGEEKTSENDQPYSKQWESVTVTGMKSDAKDARGYATYLCTVCGLAMTISEKP